MSFVKQCDDNYKFNHGIEFPGNACSPNTSTLHLLKLSFGLALICLLSSDKKKKRLNCPRSVSMFLLCRLPTLAGLIV